MGGGFGGLWDRWPRLFCRCASSSVFVIWTGSLDELDIRRGKIDGEGRGSVCFFLDTKGWLTLVSGSIKL